MKHLFPKLSWNLRNWKSISHFQHHNHIQITKKFWLLRLLFANQKLQFFNQNLKFNTKQIQQWHGKNTQKLFIKSQSADKLILARLAHNFKNAKRIIKNTEVVEKNPFILGGMSRPLNKKQFNYQLLHKTNKNLDLQILQMTSINLAILEIMKKQPFTAHKHLAHWFTNPYQVTFGWHYLFHNRTFNIHKKLK